MGHQNCPNQQHKTKALTLDQIMILITITTPISRNVKEESYNRRHRCENKGPDTGLESSEKILLLANNKT